MWKQLKSANQDNNNVFKCLWFGHKWKEPVDNNGIILIQCNRCFKIKGKL